MRESPFLDDPRDLMRRHIAQAVASPMEQVRAINIRAAEHQAALAKASGLDIVPASLSASSMPRQSGNGTNRITQIWRKAINWFGRLIHRR